MNNRGVTLVELLVAVAMVVIVLTSLTYILPSTSRAITSGNQRLYATQMAQNLLLQTQKTTYTYLYATPTAYFADPNCDCNQDSFASIPMTSSTTINNVGYIGTVCINMVNPTLAPMVAYCNTGTDMGLKNIRVRVTWTGVAGNSYVELASQVASL